jgi:hypothetical protein
MPKGQHRIEGGERSCLNCGAGYQPVRRNQNFCSPKCSNHWHQEAHQGRRAKAVAESMARSMLQGALQALADQQGIRVGIKVAPIAGVDESDVWGPG